MKKEPPTMYKIIADTVVKSSVEPASAFVQFDRDKACYRLLFLY